MGKIKITDKTHEHAKAAYQEVKDRFNHASTLFGEENPFHIDFSNFDRQVNRLKNGFYQIEHLPPNTFSIDSRVDVQG